MHPASAGFLLCLLYPLHTLIQMAASHIYQPFAPKEKYGILLTPFSMLIYRSGSVLHKMTPKVSCGADADLLR